MQAASHIVLLGIAGAVGTLLRAACGTAALRLFGAGFPWGTLLVNVVGSLAFGLIMACGELLSGASNS